MHYTIYRITNLLNNKTYIGKHQTQDLNDGYMGSGKLIKRAIAKYGIENFHKEIIHVFDNEADMNAKERELVIVSEETYNICEGGKGGFGYINANLPNGMLGKKQTLLHRNRMIEERLGKPLSKITKKKLSDKMKGNTHWLGKQHQETTKRKIGEANKISNLGARNSQYGTCWITNDIENKKIKKTELSLWAELGFKPGRVLH